MSTQNKKVAHIWLPGAGEFRGGIQVYGAWLIRAFRHALGDDAVSVFLKNNQEVPDSTVVDTAKTLVFGKQTGRFRTAAFSVRCAIECFRERPDFILVGHIRFLPLATLLRKFLKVPIWLVVYGFEAWALTSKEKQRLLAVEKIISISEYTKTKIIEQVPSVEPSLEILPCVVAKDAFASNKSSDAFMKKYNIPTGRSVLLTVSRLEGEGRRKGHRLVFKALTELKNETPRLHYIVAGDGPDKSNLQKEAEELKIPVTFTGFIDDDELSEAYASCDVFAMPSDKEGFGIVFIEALACGKPVIAARESGASDIVTDDKMGSLIDADSVSQLKAAIQENLGLEESLYAEHRRNSVLERYDDQMFFARVKTLLRSALEK